MKKSLLIFCFFCFYNCDIEIKKKISVDEFIEDELKSFSWNEVDQYPVFENCLDFNDTAQKNNCFVETITENFRINLKKNNLVLNSTYVDTIYLFLKINKKGNIKLDHLATTYDPAYFNFAEEGRFINSNIKNIIAISFDSTIKDLPKLYPAIKRGQMVDIIFKLPILISTEE